MPASFTGGIFLKIAIGADHAGGTLKNRIRESLASRHELRDFGGDPAIRSDYPDVAEAVAKAVARGDFERGILCCGSGLGIAMAANKVEGVRAAPVDTVELARLARLHNDANVLCLGGRVLTPETAAPIVNAFLTTPFEGGRHTLRLEKIRSLEIHDHARPIPESTTADDGCGQTHGFANLHVANHPLCTHKITLLRDKNTGVHEFRALIEEVSTLLCLEATRGMRLEDVDVETPLQVTRAQVLKGKKVALVPILRAGLSMVQGILKLIPVARVGHIGIYRDPDSLQPVEYFCKLPTKIDERLVLLVDPMLATGGSAVAAVTQIKKRGAKEIRLISIISAPEGVRAMQSAHPDVLIVTAALDDHLNDHGYILPGLGDAGDRIFGTH